MAKHIPGSMDIETQEKTYQAFIKWVVRAVVIILALLVLLGLVNG